MGYQGLDQMRAAGTAQYGAIVTTAGNEPLIVDYTPAATPFKHWIVEQISFLSTLTLRPVVASGNAPLTGLFLCPPGLAPESTADLAATGIGWNMNARGFQIPLADPYLDSAVLGAGPASAFGMAMRPGLKITVPFGWFIRAEVVCLSASATPGPGAASIGRLWVMGYQEDDKC